VNSQSRWRSDLVIPFEISPSTVDLGLGDVEDFVLVRHLSVLRPLGASEKIRYVPSMAQVHTS
jgi:hypothetical protein